MVKLKALNWLARPWFELDVLVIKLYSCLFVEQIHLLCELTSDDEKVRPFNVVFHHFFPHIRLQVHLRAHGEERYLLVVDLCTVKALMSF